MSSFRLNQSDKTVTLSTEGEVYGFPFFLDNNLVPITQNTRYVIIPT